MITVQNLSKTYGSFRAVDDVSFTCRPGAVTGFLGPNGAGKSTTMRIIAGLTLQDSGQALVSGVNYGDIPNPGTQIGVLLDASAQHAGRSGREILTIGARTMGLPMSRVDEMLELVSLTPSESKRKVRNYSLGMRQRLGIARALLGRPKLLVLDEPTNGLDPRGMREVRDLLVDLVRRDGCTVFVSSHLLSEVEAMCNRVGILDRGELKAEGTMAELIRQLGARTLIEVGVDSRPRALEVIARLEGAHVEGDGDDGRLLLALSGPEPADLNRALVQGGVAVSALIPRAGSLEELFLSVTSSEPGVA